MVPVLRTSQVLEDFYTSFSSLLSTGLLRRFQVLPEPSLSVPSLCFMSAGVLIGHCVLNPIYLTLC